MFWGLRYEEEVYRIIQFEATCLLLSAVVSVLFLIHRGDSSVRI